MSALENPITQAVVKTHPATVNTEAELDAFYDLLLEMSLARVTLERNPTSHDTED